MASDLRDPGNSGYGFWMFLEPFTAANFFGYKQ